MKTITCCNKVFLLSFIGLLLSFNFNSFSMFPNHNEFSTNDYSHNVKQTLEELLHKRKVGVWSCIWRRLKKMGHPFISFTMYLCNNIKKHVEREIFNRIARSIVDCICKSFVGKSEH